MCSVTVEFEGLKVDRNLYNVKTLCGFFLERNFI